MTSSTVARKGHAKGGTKVKTGCMTCRIRKVKCDEGKPVCQKCKATGRKCDGYESPFRSIVHHAAGKPSSGGAIRSSTTRWPTRTTSTQIDQQDIELLSRYFHTKSIFNVNLDCDEEARQILRASLNNPSLRHAILSLKALRKDYEASGGGFSYVEEHTPGYDYGLQQYNLALGGLAANLSSPDSNGLKVALLCCQMFISIEQVRENYSAMVQHIVRGLGIMRQTCSRPYFTTADRLVPAQHDGIPLLDVFVIKLFAAPCKFSEPQTAEAADKPFPSQPPEPIALRTIAPDIQTEIMKISTSTLVFLENVSRVQSVQDGRRLLLEKANPLDKLQSWLDDLNRIDHPDPEPFVFRSSACSMQF